MFVTKISFIFSGTKYFFSESCLCHLSIKVALSGMEQILATQSSLKMMKNAFCFILKALFVPKIFKFMFWLFWSWLWKSKAKILDNKQLTSTLLNPRMFKLLVILFLMVWPFTEILRRKCHNCWYNWFLINFRDGF